MTDHEAHGQNIWLVQMGFLMPYLYNIRWCETPIAIFELAI